MDPSDQPAGHAEPGAGPARTLRNVGICAHIDAGKTTLTERILHLCGREARVGRVDEGTSVMDWMTEERERGITITAAATRVRWGEAEINLVDTPGHVDFTVEVERCMRVLDGAIVVVDATRGVEPQTETVWRQVERRGLPALAFVNKCERPGADVLGCAASIEAKLGVRPLVVAYPIGGGDEDQPLSGVVDLLRGVAHRVEPDGRRIEVAIPGELEDEVGVLRAELVDAIGDLDDEVFQALCGGVDPSVQLLTEALGRATREGRAVPLFCGAALRGHGVPLLLDGVLRLLPSPGERPTPELFDARSGSPMGDPALYHADPDQPLALVFKVHSQRRRAGRLDLAFARIYRGQVRPGAELWNGRSGRTERVESVLRIHADAVDELESADAGDVVALAGLTATGCGDTLSIEGQAYRLEPPRNPNAVMAVLLEPSRDEEREVLGAALVQLVREDPSLRAHEDPGTGQWGLEGMGELHLEVALARLRAEFGVDPRVGAPRVASLESVRAAARGSGEVDRMLEDGRVDAVVELRLEPTEDPAAGVEVIAEGQGAEVPAEVFGAVTAALLAEAGTGGPLAGHPVCGARLVVEAARSTSDHVVEAAWGQAAVAALRSALRAAASEGAVSALEPWMAFVVDAPAEVAGGVIGDLNSRHAAMEEVQATGTVSRRIAGIAPLRELIGYSTTLRSLSKGRATFSLRPVGFRPSVGG